MWKSKTVYAGLAGIVSSFGLYMSSELSLAEFLQVAVPSLLAIFAVVTASSSIDAFAMMLFSLAAVTVSPSANDWVVLKPAI